MNYLKSGDEGRAAMVRPPPTGNRPPAWIFASTIHDTHWYGESLGAQEATMRDKERPMDPNKDLVVSERWGRVIDDAEVVLGAAHWV